MPKIKIAMNWAGACGGCDVSLLDLEQGFLDLAEIADIVYWPVALDFKRKDLQAMPDNSLDIGLFNGVLRTSEQEEDALLMRSKCKVLIAYGSCSCFGGIPGLANLSGKEEILATAYQQTSSTTNPEQILPQPESTVNGQTLTLPAFSQRVRTLQDLARVDYFLPGCPPAQESLEQALQVISDYAQGKELPPAGSFLAQDHALCQDCPRRESKKANRIRQVLRPHQIQADPELCFLEQGLICMGPFTRSGCGGLCIQANQPCRGCYGPAPGQLDPGAEAMSSLGTVVGPNGEDFMTRGEMKRETGRILDPAGSFYRFTLPSAIIYRSFRPDKENKG
ncbi:MAG: oxidoreductase [Thermodesulfobacteriota bacterium]